MGVPVNRVLEDIRASTIQGDLKRINLLEKKDVHNIKRDYNITYSTKKHENDAVSVRLWVEEMKKKGNLNPVLYYKHQGSIDSTVPHFTVNDFCLIIMTPLQSELFIKFGNDKVCIDGTHGLNGYSFQLYTIVVVDEYGNGYPVAFCFSNRSDTDTYKHYFQCIKNTIGTISSFIFMSDDEPAFYNAWCSIMGCAVKQLLCTWHVLRNWVKNLNKINGNEKKKIIFKTLKSLMFEVDKSSFFVEIDQVLNDLLKDPDTVDFGKYFEKCYSTRVEKWAMFNRKHVGINTNMYLESLHKNIKYCYLEGKHCKRLDMAINALMSLVRDKSFERVIKISKEKRSSKIMQINTAHKKSKQISQDMITKVNDDYWLVISENDMNVQYKVEKFQSFDGCALQCEECQICVHSYKCSCMNNIIYLNICKHIHACVKTELKIMTQNEKNIVPHSHDLVIDNSFIQTDTDKINKKDCEIKNKMENYVWYV